MAQKEIMESPLNVGRPPSLLLSLIPIIILMIFLGINIVLFKDDATSGPNQIALMLSGLVAIVIGVFIQKIPYGKIEDSILKSIEISLLAILILILVGALIGTWLLSGIVPAMIYYGLKIINPSVFLPIACIVCCIVSVATGSSWSTTGTVGLALIGMGRTLGLPDGLVAGAIISGAYFGDKMSPLSDTTNLAPAMVGTDIFTHIRHMMYTSGPAIILAILAFFIIGLFYNGSNADPALINEVLAKISATFNLTPWLFLSPLLILFLVAKKTPALPAIVLGIFAGVITAVLFQKSFLTSRMDGGIWTVTGTYKEILKAAYSGLSIETGQPLLDKLLNRGGMQGMLTTVWLIFMAMFFGGAMEGTGMLEKIANTILSLVKSVGGLATATVGTCFFMNTTASDQYLAIILTGRMFKNAYDKMGLHPKNLSRALEDSGTVTSPLIPWNSCGAYESTVLGVATLTYLPFCFFNILSPLISIIVAHMNWTMERLPGHEIEASDTVDIAIRPTT